MSHSVLIRAAEASDVEAMHALFVPYAKQKIILQRSQDDLYQHLQEFVVAEYAGEIVGAAALHVYGANIAEIRSLVVHANYQGKKLGYILVEACEKQAIKLHISQVFALTYVDRFFIKMGYQVVKKEQFPHKIWTVCVHCDKFGACDEIAVLKYLPAPKLF